MTVRWGANGTIFAQTSLQSGLIPDVSGGNEQPETPVHYSTTPEAAPSASPTVPGPVDPAIVEAGTELATNDAVATLRSAPAPAPDAPIAAELSGGTTLVTLGAVEDGAGFVWIPVREPESGTIGYVGAELVSLAPAG